MADTFHVFADAVRVRFNEMAQEKLFVVASDRDEIWQRYLSSFPAGSNPIFRERTEHDCSCCRQFIRSVGDVVAIQNGALVSIWDLNGLPAPYQAVADGMAAYVKGLPIRDVFLTPVAKHGNPTSLELMNGKPHTWTHFAVEAPKRFVTPDHVERRGDLRTTYAVMMRGFTELTPEAVETVADLIAENRIYRGQEFQRQVQEFQTLQQRVLAAEGAARELLGWTLVDNPVVRFRNTVVGTLVQDLSSGVDLEAAVRAYEAKVAPQNYKRPTALITKAMVQAAMKTIEEMGLEQALERRHATFADVSVNSVLFVDNAVRGQMKGGLTDLLMKDVKPPKFDPTQAQEIDVNTFMANVLPKCTSLRLYLDNALLGNFMSMTAPVHAGSRSLFRWSNDFAWSYDGNVTDSIKDRVKRAGGRVEDVAMRVSLAWSNFDDLDLHVIEPNGNHIYYGNKSGMLDVDMNAGVGRTRDPVENIRWVRTPRDGKYRVFVHQFCKREAVDVGFTVEVETSQGLQTFCYDKALPHNREQPVVVITMERGQPSFSVEPDIVSGMASQEKWGLRTLEQVKVNSVVLSPNYWDDNAVGNKHWFFILEGCKNPLPVRGIYNEFLNPKFGHHRVFEVLGDRTKCPPVDAQMSGVGFSSTKADRVTVVAVGPSLNKAYTIVFGKE